MRAVATYNGVSAGPLDAHTKSELDGARRGQGRGGEGGGGKEEGEGGA